MRAIVRPRVPLVLTLFCVAVSVVGPLSSAAVAASEISARLPKRALWIEVSANLRALSSRAAIRELVGRARSAGIDTLVPEAKNAWGFVIYESAFVPHIRTSPVARHGYPPPAEWFPRDLDVLKTVIEEAHAAGLRVHAAVNAFGEGLRLDSAGPLVGLVERRPEWESLHLRADPSGRPVLIPSSAAGTIAFVNPAHPEVQLYELAVLWEVLARYDVDGIVLDRVRYPGLDADFSDLSRGRFEAFLNRRVHAWPDAVMGPSAAGVRPGLLFPAWVAWRAAVIRDYVRAASRVARQMRPGVQVGMYVGAWYPEMFEVGQNWGQPDTPKLFASWSPSWAQASVLPSLDFVMAGLYYRSITPWDALRRGARPWRSVAGGASLAREVAGGVPVLGSVWLDLYKADRRVGERALRAAAQLTDGLMVFDLSDVEAGNWWSHLATR